MHLAVFGASSPSSVPSVGFEAISSGWEEKKRHDDFESFDSFSSSAADKRQEVCKQQEQL
jgi:hypothetical protein